MILEKQKPPPGCCQCASGRAVNERGTLSEEKDEGIIAVSQISFARCWCFLGLHLQHQEAG